MKLLHSLKTLCDFLGGSSELPPVALNRFSSLWWWRGLWWGLLATIILIFCGQTSKFIYIDF